MPNPSETTRVLNLVISLLFTLAALGLLLPGGFNLIGAFAFRLDGSDRLRALAWGLGCVAAALDVLWLGWAVVPRVFLPPESPNALRHSALLILLGVVIFVAALAVPAVVTRALG